MKPTTVTMDHVHDAIIQAARDHFGDDVEHYGAYSPFDPDTGEAIPVMQTPALLLEVEDFSVSVDEEADPYGRMLISASFVFHCVLSLETARLQQTLPQFAGAVAALVLPPPTAESVYRGNTWGLSPAIGRPSFVTAQPDEFTPGLHGRDSWGVRWEQRIYLNTE